MLEPPKAQSTKTLVSLVKIFDSLPRSICGTVRKRVPPADIIMDNQQEIIKTLDPQRLHAIKLYYNSL